MNVDQTDRYPFLAPEIGWIRRAVEAGLPVLGICLGAQLLAKALGSRVFANPVKEIGWYRLELTPQAADDALFGGLSAGRPYSSGTATRSNCPTAPSTSPRATCAGTRRFQFGGRAYGLSSTSR